MFLGEHDQWSLLFKFDRVAEHPDPLDLNLADVAVLHVLGGPFGPHPDDVARVECQVTAHLTDVVAEAEDGRAHLILAECA